MSYNSDSQKKCGFCGETIPAGAGRCPYCGSLLEVRFDNSYGSQPNQPADPGTGPLSGESYGFNDPNGLNNGQSSDTELKQENGDILGSIQDQGSVRDQGTTQGQGSVQDQGTVQDQGSVQTPAANPQQAPAPAPVQYQPQQGGQGQWQNTDRPAQDYQRPYYQNQNRQQPVQRYEKTPLSNGLKVFLTVLFTVLPGIGQLAGIITAIVFMSSEGDSDRRSFGVALLVASLIMFVLACIGCFVASLASASLPFNY
ncbi:MAG TPA: hypothetical protein VHT96_10645 [Clostridia bacterium]|nr:hypothetical protein [Clostridia bacterium]